MKKTGLFKISLFIMLGIVVTTWFISSSYFSEGAIEDLGMNTLGFFDFFQLLFSSFEFQYFIQIFLLLLSVGALYGVLNKIPAYRNFIEGVVAKTKGYEFVFLLITAFIIVALTSVFDYGFALFIFFPLLISIILAMGYDKITAAVTTFGATFVGTIGSTLNYNTSATISEALQITVKDGIIYKVVLLVLAVAILFVFLYRARKLKRKVEDDLFAGEDGNSKKNAAGILVVLGIVFVVLVLGCTKWNETFGVSAFTSLHETITKTEFKLPYFRFTADGIKTGSEKIAVFGKLLGSIGELGSWYYAEMSVICFLAALVLAALYKVKKDDRNEAILTGIKKMLRPASLVMFIYAVVFFTGNTMVYPTIATLILNITSKFNIFFASIVTILGSALHVDILYVVGYLVPQLGSFDASPVLVSLLTQGLYGLTMFVAPTSAMLALGLSYLDIPYTKWLKKTWMLALALFVVVVVVNVAALIIL